MRGGGRPAPPPPTGPPTLALPVPNQRLRLRFCRVGAGQKRASFQPWDFGAGRPHPGAERDRGRCAGAEEAARNSLLQAPNCPSPHPLRAPGLVGGGKFPTMPRPLSAVPRVAAIASAGLCRRRDLRSKCLGELGGGLESFWEGGIGWFGGRLGDLGAVGREIMPERWPG